LPRWLVTHQNGLITNGCPFQQLDQKGSTVDNDSSNISAVQALTKWAKHPQPMYPTGNCGSRSRGGNLSCSTTFPAQHLQTSGFFSCQPYGLENSPRFHPGLEISTDSLQTCSQSVFVSSRLVH